MFSGGNATVFVSDLELAVRFYTETLGLELKERYENDWAAVKAGPIIIGLHPLADFGPRAGIVGSVAVGLDVTEALEDVVDELTSRGVEFVGPIVEDPFSPVRLAFFKDQDGNQLYLIEGGAGEE
jgi:catechol 2,3-dioxygenase-like lactoylglutathione lyase family enzyme